MSSQARDFYTNSCLTCQENKAANKRNHPQDTRGEQSAVTTVDKYNCEAQGKGRAKGRPRKVTQRSFIDCRWWMVDILSLMLYTKFG